MVFNTSHFKMVVATELKCKDDSFVWNPEFFIITTTGKLYLYSEDQEFPYEDYCIEHFLNKEGKVNWRANVCLPKPLISSCCGVGEVLAPGNNTCIPYKGNVPFTPPVSMGQGQLGHHQLGNSSLYENGCSENSIK